MTRPIDIRNLPVRDAVEGDERLSLDAQGNLLNTRQLGKPLTEAEMKALPVRPTVSSDKRLTLDENDQFVMTNQPTDSFSSSFPGLSDAITAVTANPDSFDRIKTDSYRNKTECTALGITYPDGGGAEYTVINGAGDVINSGIWGAGTRQLKITHNDVINAAQYGAIAGIDSTTLIQGAINTLSGNVNSAGGQILIPAKVKYSVSSLTLHRRVSLIGLSGGNGESSSNRDLTANASSLLVSGTITLGQNCKLSNLTLATHGISLPYADQADATAQIAAFSGTGVTVNGPDCLLENCLLLGFNQAVNGSNVERAIYRDLKIDCTNGIYQSQVFDISYIENCHCWPYTSAHQGFTDETALRAGTAFKFESTADWCKATNSFSYGYNEGFSIVDAHDVALTACGADHKGMLVNNSSVGFSVTGSSKRTKIIGCQAAAQWRGIYVNTVPTIAAEKTVTIVSGFNAWENDEAGATLDAGDVTITSSGFQNRLDPLAIGVAIGAAVDSVNVSNCTFQSMQAISLHGDVVESSNISGNTYIDCTGVVSNLSTSNSLTLAREGVFRSRDSVGAAYDVVSTAGDETTFTSLTEEYKFKFGGNTVSLPANASAGQATMTIPTSNGNTGGAGSAGAGNQWVVLRINGVGYRVLHDGTV